MVSEPAVLTRLARLLRELDVDLGALTARAQEVDALLARWRAEGELPRAELVLVAVNVHGYFTALETAFERTARLFDEEVPSGATWHSDLIEQMQTAVPGLRPALIEASAVFDLHELRKFRHFFRNAYVLELDPVRVREHAERLARVHLGLQATLGDFRAFVAELLDRASLA